MLAERPTPRQRLIGWTAKTKSWKGEPLPPASVKRPSSFFRSSLTSLICIGVRHLAPSNLRIGCHHSWQFAPSSPSFFCQHNGYTSHGALMSAACPACPCMRRHRATRKPGPARPLTSQFSSEIVPRHGLVIASVPPPTPPPASTTHRALLHGIGMELLTGTAIHPTTILPSVGLWPEVRCRMARWHRGSLPALHGRTWRRGYCTATHPITTLPSIRRGGFRWHGDAQPRMACMVARGQMLSHACT